MKFHGVSVKIQGMKFKPRHLVKHVAEALRDFPVVAVTGARQTGKSTLLQHLPGGARRTYVTLDDPLVAARVQRDPDGFLGDYSTPLAIDEAQRAPDLFRAIKLAVDRDRRPGRYLLSGSATSCS